MLHGITQRCHQILDRPVTEDSLSDPCSSSVPGRLDMGDNSNEQYDRVDPKVLSELHKFYLMRKSADFMRDAFVENRQVTNLELVWSHIPVDGLCQRQQLEVQISTADILGLLGVRFRLIARGFPGSPAEERKAVAENAESIAQATGWRRRPAPKK